METLSDKTLVMIVGPSGVGKSTIMHAVASLDERFSYVRSFTTRPKRVGEETSYNHISNSEAADIKHRGMAITYVTHPTTGYVYGTDATSYPAQYNLLDTLSGAVKTYQSLPFQNTITFSVTTNPDSWQEWFISRYPHPSAERSKRLEEAVQSIRWSLKQTEGHHWLLNEPGSINATAKELIDRINNAPRTSLQPPEATALYECAKLLLSYQ